jgi:aspartyl-tRNA(Asn)/glutamyl-tRNA(Gln) amidotransferase subunit C
MSLSREEVQHIARLARIGLTPEEEGRFQKDLAGVFGLIEELKEARVEGMDVDLATRETNRTRNDESLPSEMQDDITKGFPTSKDGFNKVRAVF